MVDGCVEDKICQILWSYHFIGKTFGFCRWLDIVTNIRICQPNHAMQENCWHATKQMGVIPANFHFLENSASFFFIITGVEFKRIFRPLSITLLFLTKQYEPILYQQMSLNIRRIHVILNNLKNCNFVKSHNSAGSLLWHNIKMLSLSLVMSSCTNAADSKW